MKTVIIYESLFGNTRRVAEELARVAREHGEVDMVAAEQSGSENIAGADLVLIGGPTHLPEMSWNVTRQGGTLNATADAGAGPDWGARDHQPGVDAAGPGLRDWFHRVGRADGMSAAAFDTRREGPEALTGRASLGISRRLRHHGFVEAAAPRSFVFDKENQLLAGEVVRAHQWASSVLESLLADSVH
jgi:hypothetical protein